MVHGKMISDLRCRNRTGVISSPFCLEEEYDAKTPPLSKKGPLNVTILIEFDDIVEVDDEERTISFNVNFVLIWMDERLQIIYLSLIHI